MSERAIEAAAKTIAAWFISKGEVITCWDELGDAKKEWFTNMARAALAAAQRVARCPECGAYLDTNPHWPDCSRKVAAERVAGEWKCFHCDEVFTDRETAERHFGTRQYDAPLCVADQFELVSTRKERDEYGDLRARTVGELLKSKERIVELEAALALSPGKVSEEL